MQSTLERPTTTTVPVALTDAQTDMLLTQAASVEKVGKVKAGTRSTNETRAWSRGGAVD